MRRLLLVIVTLIMVPTQVSMAYTYNSIHITLEPSAPTPGQEVRIGLSSALYNISSLNIKWLVNGTQVGSGVGLTSTTIIAPRSGQSATIEAKIGSLTTVSTIIKPSFIDMLWEADTITPPWYKGRALSSSGSYITAMAIPHIGTDAAKPLEYR